MWPEVGEPGVSGPPAAPPVEGEVGPGADCATAPLLVMSARTVLLNIQELRLRSHRLATPPAVVSENLITIQIYMLFNRPGVAGAVL